MGSLEQIPHGQAVPDLASLPLVHAHDRPTLNDCPSHHLKPVAQRVLRPRAPLRLTRRTSLSTTTGVDRLPRASEPERRSRSPMAVNSDPTRKNTAKTNRTKWRPPCGSSSAGGPEVHAGPARTNREGPGDRGPRRRTGDVAAPGYGAKSTSSNVPMPASVIPTFLAPLGTLKVARTVFTSPGFRLPLLKPSTLMRPAVSPVS
jgi:hypothetical protein